MTYSELDAKILDYIVLETANNLSIKVKDLKPLDNFILSDNHRVKAKAYSYYFNLLSNTDVLDVSEDFDGSKVISTIPIKTEEFIKNGGFKKIVQDELNEKQRQKEKEKLEIELAKSNLAANELNKSIAAKNEEDKRRNRTERIINISLGVLNLVLLVVQTLISLYKE